jgi:type VI secretion system secreted protein VgrG
VSESEEIMYEQTDRPIKLTTPLGANALLLVGLQGREAISQLFHFELKTAWNDKTKLLPFDELLGKKITVEISPSENKRYFNGIVSRVSQGDRDENFTYYSLEVVPQLWLLDRKLRSRTFQHITIPDILKELFTGIDVDDQIQGTFEPREYCVQYRETDFAFASRPDGRGRDFLLLQAHLRRPPDGAGRHAAVPPGGAVSSLGDLGRRRTRH